MPPLVTTRAPRTLIALGPGADDARRVQVRDEALDRAGRSDYQDWLTHVGSASACRHPVRLSLEARWHDSHGGADEVERVTDDMPDGAVYVACKNRRASVCPACAETYRQDTYQLVKAGLVGGKGVPDSVTEHPCFFVTLTAPSFGSVHTRMAGKNGQVKPCRPRRHAPVCEHARPQTCWQRHDETDDCLGEPLCVDCYDYDHQAVWNLHAGELWRRFTMTLNRRLGQLARDRGTRVRVSYAKVAEYQARGVVHFHALIRIDGYDKNDPDRVFAPHPSITSDLVASHIAAAGSIARLTTDEHPHNPRGWVCAWGDELDIRPVRLSGADVADDGSLTTGAVAGYLAKYATKGTEATGHIAKRVRAHDITVYAELDTHQARQVMACWRLGKRPFSCTTPTQREQWYDGKGNLPGWGKLQRWAHTLGYGGHFSTKSRRYSTTLTALRAVRKAFKRGEPPEYPGQVPVLDIGGDGETVTLHWVFDGAGWLTLGDAALALTSAAKARERQRVARDEIEHSLAT